MMDATFLQLIRGIEWDKLTAAEAVELRTALREAVAKSENWFANLAAGFEEPTRPYPRVPAKTTPYKGNDPLPNEMPDNPKPKTKRRTTDRARAAVTAHPPKAPRRRVAGTKASGAPPSAGGKQDHPAVMSLRDSYVSDNGPDPNRDATLPIGHPRRGGGSDVGHTVDPDFAAASRKMPEFN